MRGLPRNQASDGCPRLDFRRTFRDKVLKIPSDSCGHHQSSITTTRCRLDLRVALRATPGTRRRRPRPAGRLRLPGPHPWGARISHGPHLRPNSPLRWCLGPWLVACMTPMSTSTTTLLTPSLSPTDLPLTRPTTIKPLGTVLCIRFEGPAPCGLRMFALARLVSRLQLEDHKTRSGRHSIR